MIWFEIDLHKGKEKREGKSMEVGFGIGGVRGWVGKGSPIRHRHHHENPNITSEREERGRGRDATT